MVQSFCQNFYPNLFIQPILKDDGPFKARRGEKFILKPVEIRKLKKLREKEYLYFSDEECFIFDLYNSSLKIENIFGKRTTLYEITFEIENIIKILKLLLKNERDFYLFDIIHDLPNRFENKINYHSLAIYNKDWSKSLCRSGGLLSGIFQADPFVVPAFPCRIFFLYTVQLRCLP